MAQMVPTYDSTKLRNRSRLMGDGHFRGALESELADLDESGSVEQEPAARTDPSTGQPGALSVVAQIPAVDGHVAFTVILLPSIPAGTRLLT